MNPVFFGSSGKPLFGIYHPPRAQTVRPAGVVLCYPFGQEYMRAHRAFRQLAMLLTKSGFNVFRFDYFGTGDSAGDSSEGTIEQWVEDVGTAIEELKDTSGVSTVSIVGLRLGAVLGALAAAPRADVESVVLWDPVVDGQAYSTAIIQEGINHESHRSTPVAVGGNVVGVLGFPFTSAMKAGLASIEMRELALAPRTRALVMVSEDREEYVEFARTIGSRHEHSSYQCIPATGNWNEVDNNGSALIPQAVIQGIVAYLSAETGQ
jgi:pimeloyl-ACP methyl ester carboxylesterase